MQRSGGFWILDEDHPHWATYPIAMHTRYSRAFNPTQHLPREVQDADDNETGQNKRKAKGEERVMKIVHAMNTFSSAITIQPNLKHPP